MVELLKSAEPPMRLGIRAATTCITCPDTERVAAAFWGISQRAGSSNSDTGGFPPCQASQRLARSGYARRYSAKTASHSALALSQPSCSRAKCERTASGT